MANTGLFVDFMMLTLSCLFFVVYLASGIRSGKAL